jgi:hypothetical protein
MSSSLSSSGVAGCTITGEDMTSICCVSGSSCSSGSSLVVLHALIECEHLTMHLLMSGSTAHCCSSNSCVPTLASVASCCCQASHQNIHLGSSSSPTLCSCYCAYRLSDWQTIVVISNEYPTGCNNPGYQPPGEGYGGYADTCEFSAHSTKHAQGGSIVYPGYTASTCLCSAMLSTILSIQPHCVVSVSPWRGALGTRFTLGSLCTSSSAVTLYLMPAVQPTCSLPVLAHLPRLQVDSLWCVHHLSGSGHHHT